MMIPKLSTQHVIMVLGSNMGHLHFSLLRQAVPSLAPVLPSPTTLDMRHTPRRSKSPR